MSDQPSHEQLRRKALGEAVDRLRGLFRLTRADLAQIAGVSETSITALLHGRVDPRSSTVARLSEFFSVSLHHPREFESILREAAEHYAVVENRARELRHRRGTLGDASSPRVR